MASQVETIDVPAGDATTDVPPAADVVTGAPAGAEPDAGTDPDTGPGDGAQPGTEAGHGPGVTRIALPATADIRVAAEIFASCRAALDATGDVEIACDEVERVDAAVLQCLVAVARGLDQAHRQLTMLGPSPAFVRAVDTLGLGLVFQPQPAAT